jgi:hypothetical protein
MFEPGMCKPKCEFWSHNIYSTSIERETVWWTATEIKRKHKVMFQKEIEQLANAVQNIDDEGSVRWPNYF